VKGDLVQRGPPERVANLIGLSQTTRIRGWADVGRKGGDPFHLKRRSSGGDPHDRYELQIVSQNSRYFYRFTLWWSQLRRVGRQTCVVIPPARGSRMTDRGFWENAPQLHVIEQRIDMSFHRTLVRAASESTEKGGSSQSLLKENAEDSRGRKLGPPLGPASQKRNEGGAAPEERRRPRSASGSPDSLFNARFRTEEFPGLGAGPRWAFGRNPRC